VCYFDKSKSIQKYAGWDGRQWQIDTVNNGDGGDCSIAVDAGGGVSVDENFGSSWF
jgi:hypothetical protein